MTFSTSKVRYIGDRIEDFRPDVIHVHNIYPSLGPSVHMPAHRAGIPVVMTVHNLRLRCPNGLMFTQDAICRRCQGGIYLNAVIHECFPSKRQAVAYAEALWIHRFLLRIERKVALFLAPSQFMQERLVEWGLAPRGVRLVRNFVWPHGDVSVEPGSYGIFAGRLSSEKGVEVLLQALRLAGNPPFKLVGDGPLAAGIGEHASALGLSNLSLLGRRPPDETIRLMTAARFVLVPSLSEESAGLTALEAMSLGRPMLVSHLGALPELASQGGGLVTKARDAEDLAAKIGSLLVDDNLCTRLGKAGLDSSRTLYSPESHFSALEGAYTEAMESLGYPSRRGV